MNKKMKTCMARILSVALAIVFFSLHGNSLASCECSLSKGQVLYVPVYSNIFSSPRQAPFNLSTILSIRNTDMSNSIRVSLADFYDTKGKLIKRYFDREITLAPLESTFVYIPEDDVSGGIGANFIVKWTASKEVNPPIIECLMIGMRGGQGISFVSPGKVIRENTR